MVRPSFECLQKLENKGNGWASPENTNLSRALKFALISVILLINSAVSAQNKVVVVPMAGDAKPLQNIVTVAKKFGDFDDPIEAVNSITDACVNGPYLVVIAPGVYTLSGQLLMKECVSIAGSGKEATILTGTVSNDLFGSSAALVVAANNAELSNLTIENKDGVLDFSIGLWGQNVSMNVYRIRIQVTSPTSNYGVAVNSSPDTQLVDTSVVLSGSGGQIGLYIVSGSNMTFDNSTISISGGADQSKHGAQLAVDSSLTLQNSKVFVSGGSSDQFGIRILTASSFSHIRDSYIEGATNTITANTGNSLTETYVTNSILNGGEVTGDPSCNFVFEADGSALDDACQTLP